MSVINKIPRGLRVLIVMAIFGVLIWQFATNTDYFYYSIAMAILLTILVTYLTYRAPKTQSEINQKIKQISEDTGPSSEESEQPGLSSFSARSSSKGYGSTEVKPDATQVTAKYMQMSKSIDQSIPTTSTRPASPQPSQAQTSSENPESEVIADEKEVAEIVADTVSGEPPIPLIDDETTLTEEEKNLLMNAVWYRCENPFCKYTSFLGVHHIVDEKNGGTNKLDNLIILCPYCHDLAHRSEIPENEMQDWISNRGERLKFKLEWKYF